MGIEIAAPGQLVFDLARGVERWENLLPHYARSRATGGRPDGSLIVEFIARRPLIGVLGLSLPVAWRSRTWNDPGLRHLRFVHVGGVTRGMDVTWRFETTPTGCRVSIDHDFQPRVPGFAGFVDRWFTRPIAGRTLATFKALAESIVDASAAPAESDPGPPTKQRV